MKQMYMVNPKNFVSSYLKKLVCNLTRFIYWLKEVVSLVIPRSLFRILSYLALRQILWTIVGITSLVGVSLYSWYYLLMIFYWLLAIQAGCMKLKIKKSLRKFRDERSWGRLFCLRIMILRDHSQCIIGLSKKSYIDKFLIEFNMKNSKPWNTSNTRR